MLSQPVSGIAVAVDSVIPADQPLRMETLAESLSRRFQRKIVVLPEPHQPVVNAVLDSLESLTGLRRDLIKDRYCGSRLHPLIDAVHLAFSQHRPLILSPDSIWLVIVQGFSHHVTENAEALRHRLVRHHGRRELNAEFDEFSAAGFEQAIARFSSQIREASDAVLHETLVCDFSTTTPPIRTASEVALMDTFSSYFTYMASCVCGIPKITIEGTPDDWRRIRARIEVIATYGLEWWVSRLRPILDEFVLTAEGHPTLEFWKAIYKPARSYGSSVVTGWIADLFPYLGDAPDRSRNHVFQYDRHEWALPVDQGVQTRGSFGLGGKGVGLGSFPSGLASVPVKVRVQGSSLDLDLVAGYFAVQQNPSDLSLSPVIGRCVAEPPPKSRILI